ncbi:MAG: hypothetical protein JSV05_04350 [Candidatus Bathyarchaeota archaeon]|nr:MAG: hypothetical protein JSV05_04350 [Candidatus Bathyarchaeota archaeon]
MKISASTLVNGILTAIIISSTFFIALSTGEYDPWLDVTDDGYGGIDDIVATAEHFGASGDPTKLCNITNWPVTVTPETTVFYNDLATVTSSNYSGSGYSSLHILLRILWPGPGASAEFEVRGLIWDHTHENFRWVRAYTMTMREDTGRDTLSVTIPVPSETFYFHIALLSGGANVFLNFYLSQT